MPWTYLAIFPSLQGKSPTMKLPSLPSPQSLFLTLIIVALVTGGPPTARATDRTWNNAGTDFNTTGNWTGGVPGTGDAALFNSAVTNQPILSAPLSIQGIKFTGVSGYDLTSGSGNTIALTLTNAGTGSNGAINASGSNTVDAALFLGATAGTIQNFSQTGSNTLTVNGLIAGNAGNGLLLTTGLFTFTAANTYTGNTRITGTLAQANVTSIGNAGANGNLGAGNAIEFISGIVRYTGGGETTSKGINFVVAGAGAATIDGSGSDGLTISGGITTTGAAAGAAQTLTLKGDSNSIANEISGNITNGNGAVSIIATTGQWTLSGNNAYTGTASRIGAGARLNVNSATAMGSGTWRMDLSAILDNTSAGSLTLSSNPTQTWGSFTFNGTRDLNMGTGTVTLTHATNSIVTVNAGTFTVGGAIGESQAGRSFTKSGAGTMVFNGSANYTGTTTINGGVLLINGDFSSANGAVSVSTGGTLGGSGIVGGATTIVTTGFLSPGSNAGSLTFKSSLTLNGGTGAIGATAIFEGGDLVNVQGTLTLVNDWNLTLTGNDFQDGGSMTLFTYTTAGASMDLTPDFNIAGLGFIPSGPLTLTDTGSSIILNGISAQVPEPSASWLAALGLAALLYRRRR